MAAHDSFKINHKAGARHLDVDAMTRQHLESCSPYGEEPIEPLYGKQNSLVIPKNVSIMATRSGLAFSSKAIEESDSEPDIASAPSAAIASPILSIVRADDLPRPEAEAKDPLPAEVKAVDDLPPVAAVVDAQLLEAGDDLGPESVPKPRQWFDCVKDLEAWTLEDFIAAQAVTGDGKFDSAKWYRRTQPSLLFGMSVDPFRP